LSVSNSPANSSLPVAAFSDGAAVARNSVIARLGFFKRNRLAADFATSAAYLGVGFPFVQDVVERRAGPHRGQRYFRLPWPGYTANPDSADRPREPNPVDAATASNALS